MVEFVGEDLLELDRRAYRTAGGAEDSQRFVAPEFDDISAGCLDALADDLRERSRKTGRRLVAGRPGEGRVSTDVGDQEREDRAARGRTTGGSDSHWRTPAPHGRSLRTMGPGDGCRSSWGTTDADCNTGRRLAGRRRSPPRSAAATPAR